MSIQTYAPDQRTTGPSRPRRWGLAVVAAVAVAAAVLALSLGDIGNTSIVYGWFPVFLFWLSFWTQACSDSLPWLSWKLKLTPQPQSVPAQCGSGKS